MDVAVSMEDMHELWVGFYTTATGLVKKQWLGSFDRYRLSGPCADEPGAAMVSMRVTNSLAAL